MVFDTLDKLLDDETSQQLEETVRRDHEFPQEFVPGPSFPNNPFLEDAQTAKGGLFANLGGGNLIPLEEGMTLSEFPTADGSPFGLNGEFMQPVYVNTASVPIIIEVSIGAALIVGLPVGPYNETQFGTDDQWYRIPTGIGTPYPISPPETAWDSDGNFEGGPILGGPDGDYELVEISETEFGFRVVWEYLGAEGPEESPSGVRPETAGERVEQPPEDDADAII
jgi:hypothetical protein